MRTALLGVLAASLGLLLACAPENTLRPENEDPDEELEDTGEPQIEGEPVADAGDDQAVAPLTTVFLSGLESHDPGGLSIAAYEWTLVSKPEGSTAALASSTSPQPTFFADLAGDYVFELTVMNDAEVWDSTPDQVTVTAKPTQGFYVQMSWNVHTDLDLHLIKEPADLWDYTYDCGYCNTNPSWGSAGAADDPSLDADTIDGYGPETITIDAPASGDYNINVHYYGEGGLTECAGSGSCPPATATVDVYIDGNLVDSWSRTLSNAGQVWNVATIHWPAGDVTFHDLMTTTEPDC